MKQQQSDGKHDKRDVPIVALIGFPNSGKSTLINRLANEKVAITANEAHTTRDLNWGEEVWNGMYVRFVDTGGLVPDAEAGIQKMVQIKTYSAIAQADLLVWVLDRRTNVDTITIDMMQRVWKSGKPFIVGINKVDNPNNEKDVSEYAHLGGVEFINFSAANGYNLGNLMDAIIEQLQAIGFQSGNFEQVPAELLQEPEKRKKSKHQIVKKNLDGTYYVVREADEKTGAPGNFRTVSEKEATGFDSGIIHPISSLIFDFWGTVFLHDSESYIYNLIDTHDIDEGKIESLLHLMREFEFDHNYLDPEYLIEFQKDFLGLTGGIAFSGQEWKQFYKVDDEMLFAFNRLKKKGYQLLYFSNNRPEEFEKFSTEPIFKTFDGGLDSSTMIDEKPSLSSFAQLTKQFNLTPGECILFDDVSGNIESAIRAGMWGAEYEHGLTDIEGVLNRIESGKEKRIPQIPKVLFMGKPNVGKSSLFNAMVGEEIQIVSDIAGTTLSVNDTLVSRVIEEEVEVDE